MQKPKTCRVDQSRRCRCDQHHELIILSRTLIFCGQVVHNVRHALASKSAPTNMKRKATGEDKVRAAQVKPQPNPPGIDYRSKPELYKVARGEQGVLTVEPYKAEILPHWRFRSVYFTCYAPRFVRRCIKHTSTTFQGLFLCAPCGPGNHLQYSSVLDHTYLEGKPHNISIGAIC